MPWCGPVKCGLVGRSRVGLGTLLFGIVRFGCFAWVLCRVVLLGEVRYGHLLSGNVRTLRCGVVCRGGVG